MSYTVLYTVVFHERAREMHTQNHGTLYQHMYTKIQNETQHEKTGSINLRNLNFLDLVLSCVMAVHCFDIHCNPHLQGKQSETRLNDDAAVSTGSCNGSMGGYVEHG